MLSPEVRQALEMWLSCEEMRRTLTSRLFTNRGDAEEIQSLLDENDQQTARAEELTRAILARYPVDYRRMP